MKEFWKQKNGIDRLVKSLVLNTRKSELGNITCLASSFPASLICRNSTLVCFGPMASFVKILLRIPIYYRLIRCSLFTSPCFC